MSIENHNISDIDKLGDGDTKLLTIGERGPEIWILDINRVKRDKKLKICQSGELR